MTTLTLTFTGAHGFTVELAALAAWQHAADWFTPPAADETNLTPAYDLASWLQDAITHGALRPADGLTADITGIENEDGSYLELLVQPQTPGFPAVLSNTVASDQMLANAQPDRLLAFVAGELNDMLGLGERQ